MCIGISGLIQFRDRQIAGRTALPPKSYFMTMKMSDVRKITSYEKKIKLEEDKKSGYFEDDIHLLFPKETNAVRECYKYKLWNCVTHFSCSKYFTFTSDLSFLSVAICRHTVQAAGSQNLIATFPPSPSFCDLMTSATK